MSSNIARRASDAWPTIFVDDFSSSSIDEAKWGYELGNNNGWGNGELQTYTSRPENAFIKDNVLNVCLRRESDGTWTSARLTTAGKFSFTFGRIDARIRVQPIDGPFCAVWALSTQFPDKSLWPDCGEIDIFEMQTAWAPCITPVSLHTRERHGGNPISFRNPQPIEEVAKWHMYSVEWTQTYIAFFRDGQEVGRYVKPSQATLHNWPFQEGNPFRLIVNNAVAPTFGTKPVANLTSHVMEVDFIRVRGFPNT